MKSNPEDRFKVYLAARNLAGARLASILVAILIQLGSALDWAGHSDKVFHLAAVRGIIAILALSSLLLIHHKRAKQYAALLFVLPIFIGAVGIQSLIQNLGGYTSPYYAGLNLCILGLAIIATLNVMQTAFACMLIVGMWTSMALLTSRSIDLGIFINNFFFLFSTAFIAVTSNALRYQLARNEYFANENLADANAKLKELDTMKNHFFANISHELRTPLTLSLGPVEVLLAEEERPKNRERLTMVRNNQLRLLKLIEELLDLAKLEAGKMPVRFRRTDINESLRVLAEALQGAVEARQIRLDLQLPNDSVWVYIDAPKIDKVLMNLLSNAFKFTESGGQIGIELKVEEKAAVITVRDTGAGIPADKLQSIFERFVQVDDSTTRKYSGTGIGLALVKEYVELHRARIDVTSEVGKGSQFSLRFPLGRDHLPAADVDDQPEQRKRVRTPAMSPHLWVDLQGKDPVPRKPRSRSPYSSTRSSSVELELSPTAKTRIATEQAQLMARPHVLVVDDTPDMRTYLSSLLEGRYEVHTAEDGRQGLEMARQLMPDLIISDVMMPHISGEELCQQIRAESGPLARTPIILVTARTDVDGKLTGLDRGADDYLFKPFHIDEFKARVRNLLRTRQQEMALYMAHRRLDADLEFAREFQQSLLPPMEVPTPLLCHAVYQPLDAVGGDIYEITVLEDGRVRLLLVDVTDHGVQAALRSTVVVNEYTHIKHLPVQPGQILAQLNEAIIGQFGERLSCSLCCVDLTMETDGRWRADYAQGGHAPIVVVSNQSIMPVTRMRGMILGILPTAKYTTGSVQLQRGDRLYLYTDGIEEQTNLLRHSFADARLKDVLATTTQQSSVHQAVEAVAKEFHVFRGEVGQQDDVTFIGFELEGNS